MRNGTTIKQNDDGRGVPVTRIETISDGTIDLKRVRYADIRPEEIERWRLLPGDILLSHINSVDHIGKTALYRGLPDVLIHGMNLMLLRPDQGHVLPAFLHYALRSESVRSHIRARCKRAINQASINQKELGSIEIAVPSLSEQHKAVDLLERAENIVHMRREAEQKAKEIIPALFLDMFGDPATNPKGWPIVPLGNLLSFRTGKLDSNAAVPGGPYPFFTCSRDDSAIDTYAFDCEALLLAGNNAAGEYSVKHYSGKFNAYQRTYVLNLLDASHSYEFMRQALQMRLQELKRLSLGSGTKYLTLGILKNVPIQLPGSAQQMEFADRSIAVRQLGQRASYATGRAVLTFQSLLAGEFGEI
jgi:restriction endonuclease S subunit